MNYIWQPLIEAIETGYDTTKIRYRLSERIFSTTTINCLRSLDILFTMIMTDFHVRLRSNEVLFYTPYPYDGSVDKKLQYVIKLFVPIGYPCVIHWEYTYGSIGHDESMVLEAFVL